MEAFASSEVGLLVSLQDSQVCDATTTNGFTSCATVPAVATVSATARGYNLGTNTAGDQDGPWLVGTGTTTFTVEFAALALSDTRPNADLADIVRINFFADYLTNGYQGDLTVVAVEQVGADFSLNLMPGTSRAQSQWINRLDDSQPAELTVVSDISPCTINNCTDSSADSSVALGTFACVCPPGYEGDDCTIDEDECASSPCLHDGNCTDSIDGFACACSADWAGDRCQTNAACAAQSDPCNDHGGCSAAASPTDLFECACDAGWSGATCDFDIEECASEPCGNRGVCTDQLRDDNVTADTFHCACEDGWHGERCRLDTDECANTPCLHGGECLDSSDWTFSAAFVVQQQASNGTAASVAQQCAFVNVSATRQCIGMATPVPEDTPVCQFSATGHCPTGCNRVEEACTGTAFNCTTGCEIDDMKQGSDHCPAGCDLQESACIGTAQLVAAHTPPCVYSEVDGTCPQGCTEEFSSAAACRALAACEFAEATNTSAAECRAKAVASCAGEAAATNCTGIADTPIGAVGPPDCDLEPTTDGTASCLAGCNATTPLCDLDDNTDGTANCPAGCDQNVPVAAYECTCTPGWEGSRCELDIDECASNPCTTTANNTIACIESNSTDDTNFTNHSVAVNAYACMCAHGWAGHNCELDVHECGSSPCQNGGTCHDSNSTDRNVSIGSFVCDCVDGINGTMCEHDIDECLGEQDLSCVHGKCSDSNTDPQINLTMIACACVDGYRNATCADGPYGAVATIELGYFFSSFHRGDSNESAGSTTFQQAFMSALTRELNITEGSVQLVTAQPFAQDQSSTLLVLRLTSGGADSGIPFALDVAQRLGADVTSVGGVNISSVAPPTVVLENISAQCTYPNCSSHGDCTAVDLGVGVCDCALGWTNASCGLDHDECVSSPCENGGECKDSNDATINGTAVAVDAFQCHCVAGYSGVHCEHDDNECLLLAPCQHNGTCFESTTNPLVGADKFRCNCTDGWTGDQCELDVNECDSSPCQNGGSCFDSNSSMAAELEIAIAEYVCDCRNGSLGENCAVDVDECASTPCIAGHGTCLDSNTTSNTARMVESCASANLSSTSIEVDQRECAAAGSCIHVLAVPEQGYALLFPPSVPHEKSNGTFCRANLCLARVQELHRKRR